MGRGEQTNKNRRKKAQRAKKAREERRKTGTLGPSKTGTKVRPCPGCGQIGGSHKWNCRYR